MATFSKGLQVVNSENVRQYIVAAGISAIVVWLVYQYAGVRYGVGGLSSLNKSLATSSLFLLGTVLLLGPLSRMFAIFDRALKYRKELGVLTFYISAAHVYIAMFPLARRGPWGLYVSQPLSAYSGLAALVIMFLLLVASQGALQRVLGVKAWWKVQYWGARSAFILIALHMIVLKYAGWGSWFADRSSLPPLSLLGTVFAVFVLVVRLGELLGARIARRISQLGFLTAAAFTAWLFMR